MRKAAFAPASPYAEIEVARLVPSPDNPRAHYDEAALRELAASYKDHGVLEPLIVRPWPLDRRALPHETELTIRGSIFEIAAGHRRHRAAVLAGMETVPCLVRELSDVALLEVFGIENAQREDLTPLEEALAFRNLLERAGYDVAGIAAKIGKGEGYVRARLSIDRMTGLARRAFEAGLITLSHALLIAPLSAEDQEAAAIQTIGGQTGDVVAVSAEWPYNGVARKPEELRSWIRNGLTPDLRTAPFDKADPTLNPEMGPCDGCPFRTIHSLFAETGEDDRCLKRPCFELKRERHLERRKAEAQRDGVLLVSSHTGRAPDGVVSYSDYSLAAERKPELTNEEFLSWAIDLALNDRSGGMADVPLRSDTFDTLFGILVEGLDDSSEDYDRLYDELDDAHDAGAIQHETRRFVLDGAGHEYPGLLAEPTYPENAVKAVVVDGPKAGQVVGVLLSSRAPKAAVAIANPEAAQAMDDKAREERLARKEQIRAQKAEMLARRRALDAVLAAIDAMSEEELLRIASARVDVVAAIAAVKIGHGGYSRNVCDSGLPKEMRHPGERSGLAVLGLEGYGRKQDAAAFDRTFKEIFRAFVLSATYDEIYVGDMDPKPQQKEALCLFALCGPFRVDLEALRKQADWDTLSKKQREEREGVSKPTMAQVYKDVDKRKEPPSVPKELVVVHEVLDGLPLNTFVASDEAIVALSGINAVEKFSHHPEVTAARDVATFALDGVSYLRFVVVGAMWRGDDGWCEIDVQPATPRDKWDGEPLDHVTGMVYRGTRFFDVDGAEWVMGASTMGGFGLVTRTEAERILNERVDKEAAVVA